MKCTLRQSIYVFDLTDVVVEMLVVKDIEVLEGAIWYGIQSWATQCPITLYTLCLTKKELNHGNHQQLTVYM